MRRKSPHSQQQVLDSAPVSISVRMPGGLNELVRDESAAQDMDVSSWVRKACWDQLRDVEYGAMEKRLLLSFEAMRSDIAAKQQQIWNAVSASFAVLLQMIDSDPDMTVDEGTLANALQYFNRFRSKPIPPRNGDAPNVEPESAATTDRIISFG